MKIYTIILIPLYVFYEEKESIFETKFTGYFGCKKKDLLNFSEFETSSEDESE